MQRQPSLSSVLTISLFPFAYLIGAAKVATHSFSNFDHINDEQSAQQLIGCQAYILASDLSEEDELLPTWQSLTGYRVLDTDQGELGTIIHVDETTINTLITLDNDQLLPIHEDFIIDIDQENKLLTICLPFIFHAQ